MMEPIAREDVPHRGEKWEIPAAPAQHWPSPPSTDGVLNVRGPSETSIRTQESSRADELGALEAQLESLRETRLEVSRLPLEKRGLLGRVASLFNPFDDERGWISPSRYGYDSGRGPTLCWVGQFFGPILATASLWPNGEFVAGAGYGLLFCMVWNLLTASSFINFGENILLRNLAFLPTTLITAPIQGVVETALAIGRGVARHFGWRPPTTTARNDAESILDSIRAAPVSKRERRDLRHDALKKLDQKLDEMSSKIETLKKHHMEVRATEEGIYRQIVRKKVEWIIENSQDSSEKIEAARRVAEAELPAPLFDDAPGLQSPFQVILLRMSHKERTELFRCIGTSGQIQGKSELPSVTMILDILNGCSENGGKEGVLDNLRRDLQLLTEIP